MPLLLSEDYDYQLPAMHRVRQSFPRPRLDNVGDEIRRQFAKPEIAGLLRPGMRVAVAVGSRGIRNLALIVKTAIDELLSRGCSPYIVSAMGSHGAGTSAGQRQILAGYGITESAMGVPVVTGMDTVEIGVTSRGRTVYFDQAAAQADLILPINRVKLHTDFVDDIQSGLCKMLVIGLGNHRGCTAIHEEDFCHFGSLLKEAAAMIMAAMPVGFGLAVVENAFDETALVEAIPAASIIEREKELVKFAMSNMPSLLIPQIDVLEVERIGKDISGCGFDPNILGRSPLRDEYLLPIPAIDKMILLGLTEATHGNAPGIGMFDVTVKAVFDQLDLEPLYANDIAIKCLADCKIPLVAANEEEALRVAIKCLRQVDKERLRVVRITDTLHLEYIWVSDALLPHVAADQRLELAE